MAINPPLKPLTRWELLRAAFGGSPVVRQEAATEAIRIVEDKVPVRQVVPYIARPPGDDNIPRSYNMYLGPGRPPVPMWGQGYWDGAGVWVENIDPRSIDYPPNVNATIIPRIGYGLMSFNELEYWAHVPPVARCRKMIIDEILSLQPIILDENEEEVNDPDLRWMTTYPDRVTPWASWVSRWLYNSIVFDAAATQPIYTADSHIMALRYVEGPTIFVLVNEKGDQPGPPAPAYSQIILGTQYIWLTSEQLWYYPLHPRAKAPYGLTAIEDCLPAIQVVAQMLDYSLKWYTEGTSPESAMTTPPDWTVDQVKEWQAYEDEELQGNAAVRRRRRFYPNGFAVMESKDVEFNDKLYDAAEAEIAFMHGIPPAEFGKMPSGGLGGKGMASNKTTQFYRLAIKPNIMPLINLFNRVLRTNGYSGYHFDLVYPTDSIDPTEQHQNSIDEFAAGIIRRNEARADIGRQKIPGPEGDFLLDPTTKGAADGAGLNGNGKVPIGSGSKVKVGEDKVDVTGATGSSSKVKVKTGNLVTERVAVKLEKQEEVKHTNSEAMVALFVPGEVAGRLHACVQAMDLPATARLEAVENLHVTLVAFEKLDSQSDVPVLAAMQVAALDSPVPTLLGTIGGYGVFMNGDEQVLYASLDAPELPALRQRLVEGLEVRGIEYLRDHGFTPHITLAYLPVGLTLEGINIPTMSVEIDALTLAQGEASKLSITLMEGSTRLGKHQPELFKHCGVCDDDDAYFGMPISRGMSLLYTHQGANETELVAITPPKELGLPSVPALWKAGKDEDPSLVANIGGAQYTREEAFYLFDRALTKDDEHLVPVAYVTTLGDEGEGAVLMFSRDHAAGFPVEAYDSHWVELAAVEDYAMGQTDRHDHNWLTHPDDPKRPLLIDNGLCAPTLTSPRPVASAFVQAWGKQPLSPETVAALKLLCEDRSLWADLDEVIGREASNLCKQRTCGLRDTGQIPQPEEKTSEVSSELSSESSS